MIIDAFVAVYLALAVYWNLPAASPGPRWIQPMADWLRWVGLDQRWMMFTPDPPQADRDVQAVIRRRSGRGVSWEPAPMRDLSRWRAFVAFRYREFATTLLEEDAAPCRPALVDYLLRRYDLDDDPPVEVVVVCRSVPVPGPGSDAQPDPPESYIVHSQRGEDAE